ncbi:IPTL-CTERM sorting domain-containing protein [Brevundimonas staleyi]
MHAAAILFALLLVNLSVGQAAAQTTRYVLTSEDYTAVLNTAATPCDLAPCPTLTTNMKAQGSITFSAPLAPNLSSTSIPTSQVVAYHFEDGVTTYDKSDSRSRNPYVIVTTDGAGVVTDFSIAFHRWNVAPGTGDVTGRLAFLDLRPTSVNVLANSPCTAGPTTSAFNGETDICAGLGFGDDTVASQNIGGAVSFVLAPIAPVPTLTEWAMILLGLMLAGGAVVMIQQRRVMV